VRGSSPGIGVVLVDSHPVVRAGLRLLLTCEPDLEVVADTGRAEDALECVRKIPRGSRGVVIVGLDLEGARDSFWLIRALREQHPTLPLLAWGSDADGIAISQALFVGADSFVHRGTDSDRFVDAVRRTAGGQVVLEGLPRGTFGEIAESLDRRRAVDHILTERERQVLAVAAEGLTARQIGRRLGVQERTVTTHLGRIYRKLGTTSRIGAIAEAKRFGLLSPTGSGVPSLLDGDPMEMLVS
jgi:two-component system, NarL family, nitrate/nitrite response regulator NarL